MGLADYGQAGRRPGGHDSADRMTGRRRRISQSVRTTGVHWDHECVTS